MSRSLAKPHVFLAAALWLLLAAAPAGASVRIEKDVLVKPAPHGGVRPDGNVEPGQSVQATSVALPARADDCEWTLVDPASGHTPGDPFPGQGWRLIAPGLERKGRWTLTIRVVNFNLHTTREAPRRWRLTLRCSTPSHPPACFLHPIRAPQPHDYVLASFHCRMASRSFRVTVPAGYAVRRVLGADNSLLHEPVACTAHGRAIACRGRTPAFTTTSLGFFLTSDVRRGLPLTLAVPGAPPVQERTRSLAVRF